MSLGDPRSAEANSARGYSAVRVIGSLFTADLIGRIGTGDSSLPGLRSEDYGLMPGRRLGEAASYRWNELLGAYQSFTTRLGEGRVDDSVVSLTRHRWLLPLFEHLGFGRLQHQRASLTAGGRSFPISHVWGSVPIHLVPWGRDLDTRLGGNGHAGGSRAPHSTLQHFLNASEDHLWGIVSNGQKLRVLRDAASLSDAAYLEFDLESIFEGEQYSDFVLLFSLVHASRFEPRVPEGGEAESEDTAEEDADGGTSPSTLLEANLADCWLEKWRSEGDRTGVRFREKLRDGLAEALRELGTGFLEENPALRERVRKGEVSRYDLRDDLLRLAYQVLFLFVAEDKNALLDPDTDSLTRQRYRRYFSTERLRRIAMDRLGDRHDDLWRTLIIVLNALGTDTGLPELGLPPLGGLYFTAGALDNDETAREGTATATAHAFTGPDSAARGGELLRDPSLTLSNRRLLAAVRHLARVKDSGGRWQRVDYQHLDAEELGSVYESLLELIPHLDTANTVFKLERAAGNDRKTTGSYYTPSSLVETLLDSALDPVIKDYATSGVPADLLTITVCDPACGSGHFLVAAARRIARAYTVLDAGDEEPAPEAIAKAMPKVVRNCIYGVDLNPLAVELTKVSLWLASLEPGKPLAFLDPHIKVGNALLGATPKLLDAGIPDGAFTALEGDDKKFASAVKRQNKRERDGGQISAFAGEIFTSNVILAEAARRINRTTAPGLAGIREQARRLRALDSSTEKLRRRRVADAWCAAFVWPKRPGAPAPITTDTVRGLESPEGSLSSAQDAELGRLSQSYHFFHWHLEFPEVFPGADEEQPDYNPDTGWQGGFACVVGNPPWERVKLQEKEFFASRDPDIAQAPNKAKRQMLIKKLPESPDGVELLRDFWDAKNRSEGLSLFLRESGRFPRTATGDVNTYAVFAETASNAIGRLGRFGMVLPTGIGTDATTARFFSHLVDTRRLASFLEFENEAFILSRAVDHRVRFCLLSATGSGTQVVAAPFVIGARYIGDLATRAFPLSSDEIRLVNPNTGTIPVFRSRRDAEITLGIYQRVPILIRDGDPEGNPWGITFTRMFDMANDSHLFHSREELEQDLWDLEGNIFVKDGQQMLPLYEAKMLHHYDHRFGTYEGQTKKQANVGTLPRLTPEQRNEPTFLPMPRYWVPEFDVPTGKRDKEGNPTYFAGVRTRLEQRAWDHGWLLGWRDIARGTDSRTMISSALPIYAVGHKFPLVFPDQKPWLLSGIFASFAFDYITRQKLAGTSMTYTNVSQIPVPPPKLDHASFSLEIDLDNWIAPRVLELTYTAWDMEPFARDLDDSGTPFVWDEERRFVMRCELDAAFFHLYGIERVDVEHIMETFPIVKRKDVAAHGSYRTKDTILEIYDALADASETGEAYLSVLDPPPGTGPRHPERD